MDRAGDRRAAAQTFFPGEKQSNALQYAILRAGKVISRRTLLKAEEGGAGEVPGRGRFHVTPDGRLFAFYYVHGKDAAGRAVSENRVMELRPDGPRPASPRAAEAALVCVLHGDDSRASAPSAILDVLGQRVGAANTVSYARIRLR